MKLLDNKTVLITGASRGIGRSMALMMAEHGAKVIINARSLEDLKSIEGEIKNRGWIDPLILPYDVSDYGAIQKMVTENRIILKNVDILVNNAGIMVPSILGTITPENAIKTLEVNCLSVIYHMQLISRFMIRKKEGSIINISSILGEEGAEGQVLYSASKAGIVGSTKSAAKELAPHNIRVNAISPGFIQTDLINTLTQEEVKKTVQSIKMKRIGKPEDVSKVAIFLASSLSSYVTGQVIGVDGGLIV